MNSWLVLSGVVLAAFVTGMVSMAQEQNVAEARQDALHSAAVFESQLYNDTTQMLQNWSNSSISQLASTYCTSSTDANGNTIYTCNLCTDVNGQMTGLLPSVTTTTVGVSSPLWKASSCESPVGEDSWQLTYNQGTGQFVIASTSLNKQTFASAMHMDINKISNVINNQTGTTLYQQLLAKAEHRAITKLPDTTTANGLVIRNRDVSQVSPQELLGVMYQEINGNSSNSSGASKAILNFPSIGVGANGIHPTPPGHNPLHFSFPFKF